jgi:sarcosine oxidase
VADYEMVVVGLGALGSAAAYQAVARGIGSVAGFEQFEFGHDRGASADHTRIIRRSYHHPAYVGLADQAYREWAALEDLSGQQLVVRCGGLDFYPAGAEGTLQTYQAAMDSCGVGYELLEQRDVSHRWPQFVLPAGTTTLFQEDGGLVAANRATAAMRHLAIEGGANLRERTPVTSIVARGDEYLITTGSGQHRAGSLILATDAWANHLLGQLDVHLNLEVRQEQVCYFPTSSPRTFTPDRVPVWIWNHDPGFYGLPDFEGTGLKIGQDVGGHVVDAESRTFVTDPDYAARVESFLRSLIPSGWGEPVTVKTCLYTLTPDREFVVDLVPGHSRAAIALGAAHGFKFAPAIGRAVVDLVTGADPAIDRELFAASREILTMDNPPHNYMV